MKKQPIQNRQQHTSTIDSIALEANKRPPQAIELEKAVLGALMLEQEAISVVVNILSPECFYNPSHEVIYKAIQALHNARQPIDIMTVADQLTKTGELDEIGGSYNLSQLTMTVGSAAHIEYHAQIVFERYIARQIIQKGAKIMSAGFDDSIGIDDMVSDAEREINDITAQIAGKVDIAHIGKSVNRAVDEAYNRTENIRKGIRTGVPTGLVDLDKISCGWRNSDLIVLAARPSMGKTAIMLHFAKAAAKNNTPAAVFSLEMSDISISNRLILSESTIAPDRFRGGYMSNGELKEIEIAAGNVAEMPIYIDDNCDVTMAHIRARAKALQRQGKCGIVFIDYLQLCREKGNQNRSREQEVSAMSREAKIVAKELNIPVILLSQLSRECEKRSDKKPQLSDLRDSGSIEQDADMVILIWRPGYYGVNVTDKYGNKEENYGELLIEKQRDGATGVIKFKHNVGMNQIFDYDNSGYSSDNPF